MRFTGGDPARCDNREVDDEPGDATKTGEGAVQPLAVGDDATTLAPNRRVTIRLETDLAR